MRGRIGARLPEQVEQVIGSRTRRPGGCAVFGPRNTHEFVRRFQPKRFDFVPLRKRSPHAFLDELASFGRVQMDGSAVELPVVIAGDSRRGAAAEPCLYGGSLDIRHKRLSLVGGRLIATQEY